MSVSGPLYEQLSAYCQAYGISRSGVTERVVNEFLDEQERKAKEAASKVRLELIEQAAKKTA